MFSNAMHATKNRERTGEFIAAFRTIPEKPVGSSGINLIFTPLFDTSSIGTTVEARCKNGPSMMT